MAKTKKRWKKSEILQEALQYLAMDLTQEGRKQRFICFALDQVAYYHLSAYEQIQEIKSYINELLTVDDCEYGCYEDWLSAIHDVTFEEKNTPEGFKKLQYSRRQWMLWMIEQYKQKGD